MDPLTWALLLVIVGFLIMFLELFVPSAGILGILAAACLISGVVLGFMHSLSTGFYTVSYTHLTLPTIYSV